MLQEDRLPGGSRAAPRGGRQGVGAPAPLAAQLGEGEQGLQEGRLCPM